MYMRDMYLYYTDFTYILNIYIKIADRIHIYFIHMQNILNTLN